MIFTTENALQKIRASLGTPEGSTFAAWLRTEAEKAAEAPTPCITDHPSPAASGDPHDYFSEGPYWWPDPQDPHAPYIRRDGYINPERFVHHHKALDAIYAHSLTLALAAYHLEEPRFADVLRKKLRRFFLDPATKMNPHLNYAQAIRGHCDGRGIGIIDSTGITRVVFAVELLELMEPGDSAAAEMREWLGAFYRWMRTSENGIDEKYHGNNHSTYYTLMTASLARLLGDEEGFAEDCAYFSAMLEKQMQPTGGFPREIARTNSFGYSCMNLNGFALLCEIAHFAGVDLWNRDCGGVSMSTAVRFHAPYVAHPGTWPYESIHKDSDAPLAMLGASLRLQDEEVRALAAEALHNRGKDPFRGIGPFGPAAFWFAF